MPTPDGPVEADGLLLPAERGRRALGQLGVVLTVVACFLLLEVVSVFVGAVLLAGGGADSMGAPGVAGYAALPVVAGVFTLPVFVRVWRWPALRIDASGISKVLRDGVQIAPWAALEAVRFTRNRGVLVLLVRADAAVPGKRPVPDRSSHLPYYSLGNVLRPRRRRQHHDLIVAAVERFAPGLYTEEPFRPRTPRTPRGT